MSDARLNKSLIWSVERPIYEVLFCESLHEQLPISIMNLY